MTDVLEDVRPRALRADGKGRKPGRKRIVIVGGGFAGVAAALGVEAPDEFGVGFPGFGGGNFFYAVAVPEASGAAEGGEAAFGGDAGAGEDEEAILGGELHGRCDAMVSPKAAGVPVYLIESDDGVPVKEVQDTLDGAPDVGSTIDEVAEEDDGATRPPGDTAGDRRRPLRHAQELARPQPLSPRP